MEPLAEVEVNVPGLIAIVVAPLVAQLRLLDVPDVIVAGAAENELIEGELLLFEDDGDEPQPVSAADAVTSRPRAIERCLRLRNAHAVPLPTPDRFAKCIAAP